MNIYIIAVFSLFYLFVQASPMPEKPMLERAQDAFDSVKEKIEKALESAQAKMQEALGSAQQAAKQAIESGEAWLGQNKNRIFSSNSTIDPPIEE